MRSILQCFGVMLALLGASCEQTTGSSAARPEAQLRPTELDDVLLRANEAPEGTEYIAERSGTLRVDELWPSDCCPGPQLTFEQAGFTSAYARVFEKPGHTSEPIDTRPGWEQVSSSAVLFRTAEGAAGAMDAWLEYYESPTLDALPAGDLGEEAVAVTGSPEAPAEVFYLYLWRVDRAVLSLRASVGSGTVTTEQVRELVDLMNGRVR